jgi:hypothetical protein
MIELMANIRATDRIKTALKKLRKAEGAEEKAEIRNKLLRQVSKSVQSADPLVTFLYTLGRDSLALGELEKMLDVVEEVCNKDPVGEPITYTNGFLANWAEVAAQRLRALEPEAKAEPEPEPEPAAEQPKKSSRKRNRTTASEAQEPEPAAAAT